MFSAVSDHPFSVHSIPAWKGYCIQHSYDFFLQRESLVGDASCTIGWSKPMFVKLLLIHVIRWKYVLLVEANSLPVGFKRPLLPLIKETLKLKRSKKEKIDARGIWCPADDCPNPDSK